jgi:hypothetical protein
MCHVQHRAKSKSSTELKISKQVSNSMQYKLDVNAKKFNLEKFFDKNDDDKR